MLLILDFDNTLFNASTLKKDLAKTLVEFGISEDLFFNIYQKLRKDSHYSTELYLKLASKIKKIDKNKARAKLEKLNKHLKKYLYPDAIWFLKKMKGKNIRLVLISYGDIEFQKTKIENTKVKPFFDKILITDRGKISILSKLVKNSKEKIFFINDSSKEIQEAIEKFKNIIPIRIQRKERKKQVGIDLPKVPIFSNLKTVDKYLKNFSTSS